MSLSQLIEDRLPGWARAESRAHLIGLAQTMALVTDALVDGLFDGRRASMPGQIDALGFGGFLSVDALPAIGRDRRLPRGFAESVAAYALRLRRWRSSWRRAATARGLLEQVRAMTAPSNVRLRLVSALGTWHTLEPDGTFRLQNRLGRGFVIHPDGTTAADTSVTHPWDWDSLSPVWSPELPQDPFRVWFILDAPAAAPLDDDEGVLGDGASFFGEPGMTVGTSATVPYIEQLRGVIEEWKPAGISVPYIIVSFDPGAFNPLTPGPYPAAGMPDGTWHNHGKVDGAGVRVATRFPSARYWQGPQ